MQPALTIATWIAVLGSALVAGVFFAFSTFVMPALGRRPPAEAIAAMQEINRVVVRSGFIVVFFATALAATALAIAGVIRPDDPRSLFWWAGAALYVGGTFILTIVRNVPLNDALAATDPADPQSNAVWARYLSDWTWWNSVRTAASLVATAAFVVALR